MSILYKNNFGLLYLTPTLNQWLKRDPFIENLTGTKNCYISATESNTYTIN